MIVQQVHHVAVNCRMKRARYRALHDELTGLPNREYLTKRLRVALRPTSAQWPPSLALMHVHLDGFEALCDLYGSSSGDRLLQLAAQRLIHCVPAEDFVSRLVANEFGLLIAKAPNRQDLLALACSLFDCLGQPFSVGTDRLRVRASIGVATCPTHGTTPESLMDVAGTELEKAKRNWQSTTNPRVPSTSEGTGLGAAGAGHCAPVQFMR